MFRRIPVFDADDDAPSDAWSKWGLGVAVPSVIALIGASRIILMQATLIGRFGRRMSLTGWDAVALGIAIAAVALLMHVHYFWSNTERMAEYVGLGKVIALLAGILSVGFVIVRNAAPF